VCSLYPITLWGRGYTQQAHSMTLLCVVMDLGAVSP